MTISRANQEKQMRNTVKTVDDPMGKNKKKKRQTKNFMETLGYQGMSCGGKVHKKAKGGMTCRGGGAASRGTRFSKSG